MPLYSFEVVRADGSNLVAAKRDLPSNAEAWGYLEVLAIQFRRHRDVQMCVRDSDGSIVILSRIAILIASIERCARTTCHVKDLLASGARRRVCAPCMSIPVSEIPWLDLPGSFQSVRRPWTAPNAACYRPQSPLTADFFWFKAERIRPRQDDRPFVTLVFSRSAPLHGLFNTIAGVLAAPSPNP